MSAREYKPNLLARSNPARLTDEDYAIWYPEKREQKDWRDFRLRVLSMQLDRADGERMFCLVDSAQSVSRESKKETAADRSD